MLGYSWQSARNIEDVQDELDDERMPPDTESRAALDRARNEEVDPDAMEDPDD